MMHGLEKNTSQVLALKSHFPHNPRMKECRKESPSVPRFSLALRDRPPPRLSALLQLLDLFNFVENEKAHKHPVLEQRPAS